jgi:microcystin-dependent protein
MSHNIIQVTIKNLVFLLAAFALAASVQAQVGFNNPNPDPSSLLDLTANNKGLLVPRLSSAQRAAIGSPAQSLLVFDTDKQGFYFFNSGTWYALNEWVKDAGSNNVSLNGNASISGSISSGSIVNSGTLSTSTINSTGAITGGSISTNGGVNAGSVASSGTVSGGNFSTSGAVNTGSLNVTGYSSNALVPTGAIIMWAGTTPPTGWALCDGSGGRPDLRGRFIVGYSPFDGDYSSIANSGGEKMHTLTVNEMPSHIHSLRGSNVGNFGGFGAVPGVNPGTNEGGGDTNSTGGNQAHENRPPYYTLAFIIKL